MQNIGYFISDLTSLIPVASGIYFLKKISKNQKYFLYFLIYASVVEMSNAWLASHHIYNLWSINIFKLAEYSFFVFILNRFAKEVFMRWISLVGSVIFYFLWFAYLFIYKDLNVNYAPASITESIVLMLLSGFVIVTLGLKTETPVLKNYRFWLAGGAFIYFSVSILLDYVFDMLFQQNADYDLSIWNIHSVINIGVNILYAYSFSLHER